jgi:hypothetical protein
MMKKFSTFKFLFTLFVFFVLFFLGGLTIRGCSKLIQEDEKQRQDALRAFEAACFPYEFVDYKPISKGYVVTCVVDNNQIKEVYAKLQRK